ncbi:hypothetical protein C8R43DRAFT_1202235 [Mycena crocata]|nr:hypothetical protein C8R43DRAFT_1202235 [Mycena crocata]
MANNSDAPVPLPSIRKPSIIEAATALQVSNYPTDTDEAMPPLPTLRTTRAAAPTSFDPEDEEDSMVTDHDDAFTLSREEMTLLDEGEEIEACPSAFHSSVDRPLHVRQSPRSFEARTGTNISTASESNAGSALSRSSATVIFDDMAPSEQDIFIQANLFPVPRGEKAPQRDTCHNENDMRVATHIIAIGAVSTSSNASRLRSNNCLTPPQTHLEGASLGGTTSTRNTSRPSRLHIPMLSSSQSSRPWRRNTRLILCKMDGPNHANVSWATGTKLRKNNEWSDWHDTCVELHCVQDADRLDAIGA